MHPGEISDFKFEDFHGDLRIGGSDENLRLEDSDENLRLETSDEKDEKEAEWR